MSLRTSMLGARMVAKFWIKPVSLQSSGGFNRMEMKRIEILIEESAEALLERWNEFFSK